MSGWENGVDVLNYDELDSNIRKLVKLLRQNGFDTTDSGDGSKAGTMEGALDVPHVFICCVGDVELRCNQLLKCLEFHGITVRPQGQGDVYIQGTYDPADRSSIIMLFGAHDGMLK